jgi:hypothetical protein
MRRLIVAEAWEGMTFAAVPPDCMVAATVVRTSAAGSPPSLANTCAVSPGIRLSRPRPTPARPGVRALNCASIRPIACGARARNIDGSSRFTARAMRRTAVCVGGVEA